MCLRCRQPGHTKYNRKHSRPSASAAALGKHEQLRFSATSVDYLIPCIVLDIQIARSTARTLIDTGANACFIAEFFCSNSGLPHTRAHHTSASLAHSSSAEILGKTESVPVTISTFFKPAVFQVLQDIDGVAPFRIVAVPHSFVYTIDFGLKSPLVHIRVRPNSFFCGLTYL